MLYNTPPTLVTAFKKKQGFTLIEVIIGIVTMSIALSIITSLLLPTTEHSAEQFHQIRAAELGQSLMNEIVGKAFDENSNMTGGKIRCGEGEISCTAHANLGPDGEASVEQYNDVDDYHGVVESDLALDNLYSGFTVSISVCNDSNYDGVCTTDDIQTAKLITITITDSFGNPINFATYRTNY